MVVGGGWLQWTMEVRLAVRAASCLPDVEGGELGRRAPAWVPDDASNCCQECSCLFTFLVRRHHCRACGRLLCSACCRHTCPLQYLHWYPARVCRTCKERLDAPRCPPRRSRSLSSLTDETVARLVRDMQVEFSRRRSLASSLSLGGEEEEDENAASPIGRLPQEVLSKILDQLGHSDKLVCRSVCHHWLQAIETSGFHRENIIHVGSAQQENLASILSTYAAAAGQQQFPNFRLSGLAIPAGQPVWRHLGPGLRVLEFRDCEIGEKELVVVLGQARWLTSLALVNCRETFMSGNFLSCPRELAAVRESLANLRSLCLDSNKYLCDVLLMRISEATPRLEHLSVSDCNMMNDAGIYRKHYPSSQQIVASPSVLTWRIVVRVVQSLALTLTSLDVSRNAGVDLEMLSRVEGLRLTHINLTSCSAVTQQGVLRLAAACPHLAVVGLAGCRRVFTGLRETSRDICRCLAHLTSLNLAHLSVPHFSEVGAALCQVTHLVIDDLDAPGGEILAGLRQLDASRLESLQARFLSVSSPELRELIASRQFPRLRRLDLSHGRGDVITNDVLQAICTSMRGLTHLNLANNPSLSDAGAVGADLYQPAGGSLTVAAAVAAQADSSGVEGGENGGLAVGPSGLSLLDRLICLDLSFTGVSNGTLRNGIAAPDLRQLSLNQCLRVEDDGLYQLAARHPRLERLELRAGQLTDTGLVSVLSCLPRLVHLDLSSSSYITSIGVKAIGQVAPQLQTLLLSNCANVSVEAARALEMSMPVLRGLETHGLQRERLGFLSLLKQMPPPPPPPLPSH